MNLAITLITLLTTARADPGEFGQIFGDTGLDHRACIAIVLGYEYLAQGMSSVNNRYLTFFNDPLRHTWSNKTRLSSRYRDL